MNTLSLPLNDFASYPWAIINHQEFGHTVFCRFSDKETAEYYLKSYRRQNPGNRIQVVFSPYARY